MLGFSLNLGYNLDKVGGERVIPEGRRAAQRARMRARLQTAALDLFARNGYEATTIGQIAEAADVARQTVLNHYPHKRDFLRAWGQQRRDQATGFLAGQAQPGEPARAQLHRYFAALAQMNERERARTQVLYLALRHDEVLAHERPVPPAVLDAIRRGQQHGEFDTRADPAQAAEVLTAVYFDTLTRWLTEPGPPSGLAPVLASKLDLMLDGLAVP